MKYYFLIFKHSLTLNEMTVILSMLVEKILQELGYFIEAGQEKKPRNYFQQRQNGKSTCPNKL